MDNYYIRKINPDGTGDVVVPKMAEPEFGIHPDPKEYLSALAIGLQWKEHLESLPSVGIAEKPLVEANGLGRVNRCEVGYQQNIIYNDNYVWQDIDELSFIAWPVKDDLRLVLSLPKNSEEETVTLTRKQVEEIWDASKNRIFEVGQYPYKKNEDYLYLDKETYINSLFKKY